MSEVFHQSDHESNHESDQSSIESSSDDDQEDEGETSSSDEERNGLVTEESVVRDVEVEVREEEDELPDVELDEKNSTEVNKSKLKDVTVKPQEKVPRWNNERLYPPSSKCKSKAWQFGGFLKDSKTGQLLTQKTVCGFCGLKQNYRCSPTNLDQHMAAAHSLEYEGVGLKIKERSKMEDFFQPKTNISTNLVILNRWRLERL